VRHSEWKDCTVALHGSGTGRIVRLPSGEYVEILGTEAQWRRIGLPVYSPVEARRGKNGRISHSERLRVALARIFFSCSVVRFDRGELHASRVTHRDASAAGSLAYGRAASYITI
jgi:ubiquinol-cytochrome c reductase cytochrome b subunit